MFLMMNPLKNQVLQPYAVLQPYVVLLNQLLQENVALLDSLNSQVSNFLVGELTQRAFIKMILIITPGNLSSFNFLVLNFTQYIA